MEVGDTVSVLSQTICHVISPNDILNCTFENDDI